MILDSSTLQNVNLSSLIQKKYNMTFIFKTFEKKICIVAPDNNMILTLIIINYTNLRYSVNNCFLNKNGKQLKTNIGKTVRYFIT